MAKDTLTSLLSFVAFAAIKIPPQKKQRGQRASLQNFLKNEDKDFLLLPFVPLWLKNKPS